VIKRTALARGDSRAVGVCSAPSPMNGTVRARLILRSPSGDPPGDAETVRVAREALKSLGFRVVEESPAGIAFSGDADRFEEVFGSPAETPIAVPAELADVATDVVLPRRPETFP
jgi:hypothetical protein